MAVKAEIGYNKIFADLTSVLSIIRNSASSGPGLFEHPLVAQIGREENVARFVFRIEKSAEGFFNWP